MRGAVGRSVVGAGIPSRGYLHGTRVSGRERAAYRSVAFQDHLLPIDFTHKQVNRNILKRPPQCLRQQGSPCSSTRLLEAQCRPHRVMLCSTIPGVVKIKCVFQ